MDGVTFTPLVLEHLCVFGPAASRDVPSGEVHAEVTAFGLPLVVVPYPHAGAHQRRNAVELAEAGAARLVENEAFDGRALLDALDIIEAPEQHLAMSAAARAMGRPGSADAVAELLLALAERRALPDPGEVARIAAGPMRAAT